VEAGKTVAHLLQFDCDEVIEAIGIGVNLIEDIGIGVATDKRRVVEPRQHVCVCV
jgi:hypothetical protein